MNLASSWLPPIIDPNQRIVCEHGSCQRPDSDGPASSAVPDFVGERAQALLTGDWQALERLLDGQLCYVHATGVRHDKPQYLRFVKERIRFLAIELQVPQVVQYGDIAVITGCLRQSIVRVKEEAPVEVQSWVTEVWRKTDHWRLCAFQSTRTEAS